MVDRIERELLLPAPPEEVWEVVTGPGWLADEVALELFPGGDARFSSNGEPKSGWVEEVLAPGTTEGGGGRLAFWWGTDGDPATRVELTLKPDGDAATRLRVVEARPLELLDLVGIPLPGTSGPSYGPAMLMAA